MSEKVHHPSGLIYSVGTQVVVLQPVLGAGGRVLHPRGAVAVVIRAPDASFDRYRVRFPDGVEDSFPRDQIVMLAYYQAGDLGHAATTDDLYQRVILRCVLGSRAYGLEDDRSDIDRRGIFLPTATQHWSLTGVPEQIERHETQEHYWEIQRFMVLALKANPNVLETLFTPLVEYATPLAERLLAMRTAFLSRLIYQTYNGYALSQFRKMQADVRNHGQIKWKHVMHLLRLLLAGAQALREGLIPVRVEAHRERLLAIKHGQVPWDEIDRWRKSLHADFDRALAETRLPERPDYAQADALLLAARREAARE